MAAVVADVTALCTESRDSVRLLTQHPAIALIETYDMPQQVVKAETSG